MISSRGKNLVALDDQTLDELWSVNVGTGFNAPPVTYAVDGKQYIAIASGLYRNARNRLERLPDLKTEFERDDDLRVRGGLIRTPRMANSE